MKHQLCIHNDATTSRDIVGVAPVDVSEKLRLAQTDERLHPLLITAAPMKDVLTEIAGFLDPSNQSTLALVNSKWRDAVVSSAKEILCHIRSNHASDETFQSRIRESASTLAYENRPREFPTRLLHHAAKINPLYTLETAASSKSVCLALNPSGTRLALLDHTHTVRIWDVAAKEFIQRFSTRLLHEPDGVTKSSQRAIYYFNDRIVACRQFTVRTFTEGGVLLNEYLQQQDFAGGINRFCSSKHGQKIFFTRPDGSIVSFNVISGEMQKIVRRKKKAAHILHIQVVVVHGKPMMVVAFPRGLSVYDMENKCAKTHSLPGTFRSVVVTSYNSSSSILHAIEWNIPPNDSL